MNNYQKDIALEALLEAAQLEAPTLSSKLVYDIYQVEKAHQFSPERKPVADALQQLLIRELESSPRGGR